MNEHDFSQDEAEAEVTPLQDLAVAMTTSDDVNVDVDVDDVDEALTDPEAPSDPDYDIRFRRQYIETDAGRLVIPAKYEVWADGVFERDREKIAKYPEGLKPPKPNLYRRAPKDHARAALNRIAERPLWVSNRGERPCQDGNGSAIPLIYLSWKRYSPMDLYRKSKIAREIDGVWIELGQIRTRKAALELSSLYDLPIYEHNSAPVIMFLSRMYEANFSSTRSRNVVRRTGHYDIEGHSWLIGSTPIGSSDMVVDSKDQHKIQAALHAKGSYEDWKTWSKGLCDDFPLARWMLACSFASPLLSLIGCRIFVVHHFCQTRGGKTALASFGQSVWGRPADQIWNWNATEISMNEVFRHISEVPVVFNELQASKLEGRPLANVIYAWCEGTPRERTKQTGGLMHPGEKWHCLIRTTGEQSIISRAGDVGGLASRVLEIPDLAIPEDISKHKVYPYLDQSYGHAGVDFLSRLAGLLNPDAQTGLPREFLCPRTGVMRSFEAALKDVYAELKSSLLDRNVDEAFVDRLAAVMLAERLMLKWIYGEDEKIADKHALDDALMIYGAMSGRMSSTAPLWQRVVDALLEHQSSAPQQYCDLDTVEGCAKARKGMQGATEFIAFKKTNREGIREIWYNPAIATKLVATKLGVDVGEERCWGDLGAEGILRKGDKRLKVQRSCADAGLRANTYYFVCYEERLLPPDKKCIIAGPSTGWDWTAFDGVFKEE